MFGNVFDIQRFSLQDGPGIRTTVFLKGCPLRCAWCHNPEAISPGPRLSFLSARCTMCGDCVTACPVDCHAVTADGHRIERQDCSACGGCAEVCPSQALEISGHQRSVAEVLAVVERDRPFYASSGGGLTISGGEPTVQPLFTQALLEAAGAAGIHRCVETCGQCAPDILQRIAPHAELFLYDCKETDSARHQELTGVGNERIVANLAALVGSGAAVRLRCPMLPEVNDRDGHLDGIIALARSLPGLRGVEILPYHTLGEGKLARFGLTGLKRITTRKPTEADLSRWQARLDAGLGVIAQRGEGTLRYDLAA